MKRVLGIAVCCGALALGAYGQRAGGGRVGGFAGHGAFGGGARGFGGGFNRGFSGGFNRGFGSFNRLGRAFDHHRGWGWGLGAWPLWGWGAWPYWGWDFPYYGFDYGYPDGSYPTYGSAYAYSPDYQPNVTVVYPPEQATQISYQQRANPVVRNYDQYGQEVGPSGSSSSAAPARAAGSSLIYLVAFKDGVIRAAESYSVSGNTLHYVTLQHEEKSAPLDSIDRSLSQRLNRERNVAFQLP